MIVKNNKIGNITLSRRRLSITDRVLKSKNLEEINKINEELEELFADGGRNFAMTMVRRGHMGASKFRSGHAEVKLNERKIR